MRLPRDFGLTSVRMRMRIAPFLIKSSPMQAQSRIAAAFHLSLTALMSLTRAMMDSLSHHRPYGLRPQAAWGHAFRPIRSTPD